MQTPRTLKALFAALLALSSLAAAASDRAAVIVTVTVAGVGKCTDCAKTDVMRGDAFKGLRVAVMCKNSKGGKYKTSAVAVLSNNGEFSVELPSELLSNDNGGGLKEECFAELRSASGKPCPSSNGIESSKIVRKHSEGKQPQHVLLFGTTGQLVFSKDTCASAINIPWTRIFIKPPRIPVKIPPRIPGHPPRG
ncbi:Proline-rich protein 4 [Acorus calamus]|uniref:Proline-rich protein 4 n=1 Tax=Acorus calamus TaxID=4465 RepID=A0AAV9C4Q4_ACOCL|nr:Proline-rich protein 4 [Acorus calamus]